MSTTVLKRARLECELTQQKLGYLAGVPAPRISAAERGLCGLSRSTRERLAGVLGVSADGLLDKVDEAGNEAER